MLTKEMCNLPYICIKVILTFQLPTDSGFAQSNGDVSPQLELLQSPHFHEKYILWLENHGHSTCKEIINETEYENIYCLVICEGEKYLKSIILCHVVAEEIQAYFVCGKCVVASYKYIFSCEQYRNALTYQM